MSVIMTVKAVRDEDGALQAECVKTGKVLEEGTIRDIQLLNAEKHGQLIEYNTKSGRAKRLKPEKTEDILENAGKLDFISHVKTRDPQVMFDNLIRLTKMVAKGVQPSLIVTGGPGLGKTHIVKETLTRMGKKESIDFEHYKGRSTTAGLYITLYENSDSIIILDDCDSVFDDPDAVNLLKSALDSYDKRILSYLSSKPLKLDADTYVPRQFEFTGKIIFISNRSMHSLDPAIRSRSFVADISMTTEQMFKRMHQLKEEIEPNIPIDAKDRALAAMESLNEKFSGVEINLRSFIKAARVSTMGFDNVEDMIAEQIIMPK